MLLDVYMWKLKEIQLVRVQYDDQVLFQPEGKRV